MGQKRSAEEIARILESYRSSGLTRREFCERHSIPLTTLDYHRHRLARKAKSRMVKVKIQAAEAKPQGSFSLMLVNGRRIESGWGFAEAELARLIRIAESA